MSSKLNHSGLGKSLDFDLVGPHCVYGKYAGIFLNVKTT